MRSVFTEIGVSPDGNSGSKSNFGGERKHYYISLSCLFYTWLGEVKKAFNAVSQMRPLKPTHKQETDIK